VLWEWGPNIVSHQHDPTVTSDGNVLIFDNGTHHATTPRSRVVEVDPKNDQIVWEYRPKIVFSFFSGTIGGCERVAKGNTLFCEGQSGRVFEVTPDGRVCWEFISPWLNYWKGVYASMFFRAHRYYADSPQLKGRRLDGSGYDQLNSELGLLKK
jgi:outer membrane protein assembly factor BamB